MTIAYYAGKVAIGTAAERAALSSLVAGDVGYHFRESDTGKVYYWTGSAWAEQVVTGVGGTTAIANGGTGQTTATAAFDALSPMTALGDSIYGGASGTRTRLAGNITTTNKFLSQTGNGSVSAAPAWAALLDADIPTTLTGKTLTTATIDPQLNTIPNTRYFGQTKKIGRYNMVASTGSGEGLLAIAPGTFGTVGSVVADSTGLHLPYTTGTVINTTAGLRWTRFTARSLNPWMLVKAKLNSTANVRASIFLTSSSANPTTNADSLANLSGVGFFYDSAVNANWRIYSNSGGASSTNADSAVAATTNLTTFEVKAIDATPAFQWRINGYPAGAWSANVTSTIPATNTFMCIQIWIEDLASTDSKQVDWYDVQVIQDG